MDSSLNKSQYWLQIQIPGASEEPAPQLDEHYLYSLKDYQPFESDTYDGQYMIIAGTVHN